MVANEKPPLTLVGSQDGDMTELSLLLPISQVEGLERVAHAEGVTIAQLLRRLVHNTVSRHTCGQREQTLFPERQ